MSGTVQSEVPVGVGGGGGGQYLGSALQVRPDQLANDQQVKPVFVITNVIGLSTTHVIIFVPMS